MSSKGLETIRAYWEASERGDWPAAGACIGPGYRWIDHATGVDARTREQLVEARDDASCWSDTRIEIEEAFSAEDGAVIVRAVHSARITGTWRSMDAKGQRVSYPACTIFKFDSDDRIIFEETYYDMSAVRRQLGYDEAEDPR